MLPVAQDLSFQRELGLLVLCQCTFTNVCVHAPKMLASARCSLLLRTCREKYAAVVHADNNRRTAAKL